VEARLLQEYGVTAAIHPLPYACAGWLVPPPPPEDEARIHWPYSGFLRTVDSRERCVCLFETPRTLEFFREKNPGLAVSLTA
jgi:peptide subunit release factor RF-3